MTAIIALVAAALALGATIYIAAEGRERLRASEAADRRQDKYDETQTASMDALLDAYSDTQVRLAKIEAEPQSYERLREDVERIRARMEHFYSAQSSHGSGRS